VVYDLLRQPDWMREYFATTIFFSEKLLWFGVGLLLVGVACGYGAGRYIEKKFRDTR